MSAPTADETPLTFGRHKGLTPLQISEIDPGYIIWMWETLDQPPCTEDLYASVRMDEDDHDAECGLTYDDLFGD